VISPDRIVGRANELQALGAFVEAALGAPSGVLLEGEAGAGKTTLFLAGVAAARERGARVLVARPAEAEGSLGLTGIADLLDAWRRPSAMRCGRSPARHR
jgi:predicted ATP-dependent serine protease